MIDTFKAYGLQICRKANTLRVGQTRPAGWDNAKWNELHDATFFGLSSSGGLIFKDNVSSGCNATQKNR